MAPVVEGETAVTPSFDELLPFFRRAGFMPTEKERLVSGLLPAVRETFDRAASPPLPVLGACVIREAGDIVGYVSCVRAYDRTWMFQHLAALRGRQGGRRLSQAIVEHLLRVEGCAYFKMWFHTDNPFPNRVFGDFARSIEDPEISTLRTFGHLVLPAGARWPATPEVRVEEAHGSFLAGVERYLSEVEGPLVSDADDLVRARMHLGALDAAYERRGLFRRRHVLAATLRGELAGVALAEISSPGLNLSEGLSSFRIHVRRVQGERLVRQALLNALAKVYAREGRPTVLGLVPRTDLEAFADLGIRSEAESSCWTCRASKLPEFLAHLVSLRGTMRRREA